MLATAAFKSVDNTMTYQSPSQADHYTPMPLQAQAQAAAMQQQQQLRHQQSQEYIYPTHPPSQPGPLVYHSPTSGLQQQELMEYHQMQQHSRPQSQLVYPGQSSVHAYQLEQLYPGQANGYGYRPPQELIQQYEMLGYAPSYAVDNYNASAGPSEYRGWGEEDDSQEYNENGDLSYNPAEVKHRRRTTPEQFRVLEESFMQNPKPTNQHRKILADMLGMTTRGVQVWFQNRRAKAKATVKKDLEAQRVNIEEHGRPNPSPLDPLPASGVLSSYDRRYHVHETSQPGNSGAARYMPPAALGAIGRRVSLGAIQERAVAPVYDDFSPRKVSQSPSLGSAAQARRGSLPYPSPLTIVPQRQQQSLGPIPSSPSSRHLPQHVLGMRAGRRASLPNGAMTVSSGPFTPPRVGNIHPLPTRTPSAGMNVAGRLSPPKRELSPIADHEQSLDVEGSDRPRPLTVQTAALGYNSNLQTPASANYSHSPSSFDTVSPEAIDELVNSQFSMSQGPLPNPSFSFGSAMPVGPEQPFTPSESNGPAGPSYDFTKARFGSIASIDTAQTDVTEGGSSSEWGMSADWINQVNLGQIFEDGSVENFAPANPGFMSVPQGFHPDARRASAPADLLHNFAFLGVDPIRGAVGHHRPSPLNQGYSLPDEQKPNEQLSFDNFESTGPSPVEVQINGIVADGSPNVVGIAQAYLSPVNSDLAPSPHSTRSGASHSHSALSVEQPVQGNDEAAQWDQPQGAGDIFTREQHGLFDP